MYAPTYIFPCVHFTLEKIKHIFSHHLSRKHFPLFSFRSNQDKQAISEIYAGRELWAHIFFVYWKNVRNKEEIMKQEYLLSIFTMHLEKCTHLDIHADKHIYTKKKQHTDPLLFFCRFGYFYEIVMGTHQLLLCHHLPLSHRSNCVPQYKKRIKNSFFRRGKGETYFSISLKKRSRQKYINPFSHSANNR